MDKNTVIGMLLMCAVIFGFMYLNQPSEEELQRQRDQQQKELAQKAKDNALVLDSLTAADVDMLRQALRDYGGDSATLINQQVRAHLEADGQVTGTVRVGDSAVALADLTAAKLPAAVNNPAVDAVRALSASVSKNGPFTATKHGVNQVVKLKNDSLQIEISSRGGMITRATLPAYKSSAKDETVRNAAEGGAVEVISPGENSYGFVINTNNYRCDTRDSYFTPQEVTDSTCLMAMNLPGGAMFGIKYTLLKQGQYMVRMQVVQRGMSGIVGANITNLDFNWSQKMSRHEAGKMFEERNSAIYYKFAGGDVDHLSESGDKEKKLEDHVKWISTKNQFFSAALIADGYFDGAQLHSVPVEKDSPDYQKYLKQMTITSSFSYNSANPCPQSFFFFLGPNRYRLLKNYQTMMTPYGKDLKIANKEVEDLHLTKLIPLGWSWLRWINTGIIIPVFNWLGSFISNYGIVILILTLLIKLVLSPFMIKSYVQQAKMRILAPDVAALNEKYPGQDNAMKRQQKTMELYNQAGTSMFGGCLPMLIQFPILIAVFGFFPSCIELRGQSFLWAHDLSAPDAIVSWGGQIPFITNYFGNHISLFCLLMTVTNIMFTYLTMQSQQTSSQMPGMKWMMYLMPIFFLVFFNNYAAGLSYYYFLSLLITIILTYATRACVSEKKVRATMAANAANPKKKKSGFMARLEEIGRAHV